MKQLSKFFLQKKFPKRNKEKGAIIKGEENMMWLMVLPSAIAVIISIIGLISKIL